VSFSDWLRQQAAAGPGDLRDIITLADDPANQADWRAFAFRNDSAPYLQFLFGKAAATDKERLVAALTTAFGQWSAVLPGPDPKKRLLTGPNVLVAAAIVIAGVIIVGLSSGLLDLLAKADYARGLITFLFATCTIATILIVVISIIWMDTSQIKDRFQPAKDIITILIGVLGTILGFYFGLAEGGGGGLALTNLVAKDEIVRVGESTVVTGTLGGGAGPYRYSVTFAGEGSLPASINETVSPSGALSFTINVPDKATAPSILRFTLTGQDAGGKQVTVPGSVFVVAKEGQPAAPPTSPTAPSPAPSPAPTPAPAPSPGPAPALAK
jgi:hypothetical protein